MKTVAFVCVAFLCGCEFIVKSDQPQCTVDADCSRFGVGVVCQGKVCVASGLDASSVADSGLGPPGCFAGTPTTDLEFFNACTTSAYLAFDNCARLGLCDGGGAALTIEKPDAGAAVASVPLDAGPSESCYDAAARPNVIFMNGSTNFTPFVRVMAPLLHQSGFTIVWQPTSSCAGADTAFNSDPARRVMRNPTNSNQSFASYYEPRNLPNGTPCLLGNSPTAPAPNQELADLGQSDIYAASCPQTNAASPFGSYDPDSAAYADVVRHYLGPVQSMVFVVPASSSQRSISAEAARLVFGSSTRSVTPWVDPGALFVRSATTGTVGIISRGIGVPATDFWGVDQRTAPNLVSQMKSVSTNNAERTLGLLSIDFADKEKDNLHILYFQPAGARVGFLPDLFTFTRDKENVRDGHYPLWGPIHLYARVTAGDITSGAKAFVTQFAVPRPDQALLDATIETGNVPGCAMRVARDREMGPLRSYEAPFQCHCYYEKKLNGGTGCKSCAGPAECPSATPACNLGYCEKQ